MSRIGKMPVPIPSGVSVDLEGSHITVKGPRGELSRNLPPEMLVSMADDQVTVTRPSEAKRHKALHGLTRTLVANMVDGVTAGFSKTLEIQGVGYRAEAKPFGITLIVGYSHTVDYKAPEGIKISVDKNTVNALRSRPDSHKGPRSRDRCPLRLPREGRRTRRHCNYTTSPDP